MVSKIYLEGLAGTCGHVASLLGSWEYNCINNFRRGDLHICVLHDYRYNEGKVVWKNREVFSYSEGEEEIWVGEEPEEDMGENYENGEFVLKRGFHSEKYIPGPWERQIIELCDKSETGILVSD